MSEDEPGKLIEDLYRDLRHLGGQQAQLARGSVDGEIVQAFERTVSDLSRHQKGSGPFFPSGSRAPLVDLDRDRRATREDIADTVHLQALLGRPPRWPVSGNPDLDFEFVARELTPMSSVRGSKRVWLVEQSARHLSLDALLVNADDRTPIVAELKVGDDENAELALVQALAAAAQLSTPFQMRRLHREYRDQFGSVVPRRLDVYVITSRSRPRGVRPELARRAHTQARELVDSGSLDRWIRRIAFLEASLSDGVLTLRRADIEPR